MPVSIEHTPLAQDRASGETALVIIDMLSDWRFPDADIQLPGAEAITPAIARLKARCSEVGVPTIYANDNQGRWRSDFREVVGAATRDGSRGRRIGGALEPGPDDYFVLKPKHSAFHATPFDLLLRHLGVSKLLLTGVSGDQCVLYTAVDARMHDYQLLVPRDTIASLSEERNRIALEHLEQVLHAATGPSDDIGLPPAKEPQ